MYKGFKIGVVTPTRGDRPQFIERAKIMLANQSLTPDTVIYVDYPPKNNDFDLVDRYRTGFITAFATHNCDLAFAWEEDDWYDNRYLEIMVESWLQLDRPDIIGINSTIFYHIIARKYKRMDHPDHAAMFCTAVTKKCLDFPWVNIKESQGNQNSLDWFLWENMKGMSMYTNSRPAVGIKHNTGLCAGHGHIYTETYSHSDPEMEWLKLHVDPDSFNFYKNYTNKKFKVMAIVPVYNEIDILPSLLLNLKNQGVDAYFIDNWSTDGSYEYLVSREQDVERFGDKEYNDWYGILSRIEEVANNSNADWCIHWDADEIIRSPYNRTIYEELCLIQEKNEYNAVACKIFQFVPTNNDWMMNNANAEESFPYYTNDIHPSLIKPVHRIWKQSLKPDIKTNGGHFIVAEGLKLYPDNFILKHYFIRSQQHGEKKIFADRQKRNKVNLKRQWSVHYEDYTPGHNFIYPVENLIKF